MRCIVNANFEDNQYGEIVEVDEGLYGRYLDLGWLSPVDENGEREIPAATVSVLADEPEPSPPAAA
jgi:hypothetical protein